MPAALENVTGAHPRFRKKILPNARTATLSLCDTDSGDGINSLDDSLYISSDLADEILYDRLCGPMPDGGRGSEACGADNVVFAEQGINSGDSKVSDQTFWDTSKRLESSISVDEDEEQKNVCTVAICSIEHMETTGTPLWKVFACAEDPELPPSTCKLSYAQSRGLNDKSLVRIHTINAIELTTAVIELPAVSYDIIKNVAADEIYKHMRARKILWKGQYLEELNGVVIYTEPVDQGRILLGSTRVTFVKRIRNEDSDTEDNADSDSKYSIDDLDNNNGIDQELNAFLNTSKTSDKLKELALSSVISASTSITVEVKPLSVRISHDIITPQGSESDDEESRGYTHPSVLAKLGSFSGDWVTISGNGKRRAIRLYSHPLATTMKPEHQEIHLCPMLIFNIGMATEVLITNQGGSPQIAREITIARVPSPISTDKALQQGCVIGLRHYFEMQKRVIAQGDLIAIPIDELMIKATIGLDNTAVGQEEYTQSYIPVNTPTAVAWFKISEIISTTDEGQDSYMVEVSSTRVVQTGTESSFCPPSDKLPWMQFYALPSLPKSNAAITSRLRQLMEACTLFGDIHLPTAVLLFSSKRGAGKSSVVRSIATEIGLHCFEIDANDILSETDTKTLGFLKARIERASECAPCVILIQHIDAICRKSENGSSFIYDKISEIIREHMNSNSNSLIVATTSEAESIAEEVRSIFNFELELSAPGEEERRQIFEFLMSKEARSFLNLQDSGLNISSFKYPIDIKLAHDTNIESLATMSAGLVPPDLVSIVKGAYFNALDRIERDSYDVQDYVFCCGGHINLNSDDFEKSIGDARKKLNDSIGAPRIPTVKWEDIGGLSEVKKEILDTIEMPLKFPELFSGGIKKRSGILFYGPPGTGKTLLAKAIATSFSLNFFSVKGPELLNMYIGESEANVRRVFQRARDARPCVVFFDELDSVAPKRGNQGDSGGVMDRIVSQLLAELDGMSTDGGEGVFVVGATNRPDLLDEALLRPGRFDKMLYLGVSDTHVKQKAILQALVRKFKLSSNVSLDSIADSCPFTYTGADFYALCSDAMLNAMTRIAASVDKRVKAYYPPVTTRWWFDTQATSEDVEVIVCQEDFEKARRELVSSVSDEELKHYARVRESFEGGKSTGPSVISSGLSNDGIGSSISETKSTSDGSNGVITSSKGKGKAKLLD
ncbi:P-loop containing nucleoside triphosphate hydrolase protein [Dipodascopsis uninucleata]